MRNKTVVAMVTAALPMLVGVGAVRAGGWEIDGAHSGAHFSVRHLMVSNVRGDLSKITGTLNLDDKDISKSTVEATIDASTVSTGEPKRDEHLRSADFFDVAKFPQLTFKSTKVEKAGDRLKVTGNLTIHGVTKSVTLDVEPLSPEVKDPWGNVKRGASATTKISRKEFGLGWNKALETGGVVVGDEVSIQIDLELNKKK